MSEVAAAVTALSRHCASTAMIYAMHQIQVACLVRHGHTDFFRELPERSRGQPASARLRHDRGRNRRGHAHERVRRRAHRRTASGSRRTLRSSPTERARTRSSRPHDGNRTAPRTTRFSCSASLRACTLEPKGEWDTLGFRGTCSLGFHLVAEGDVQMILHRLLRHDLAPDDAPGRSRPVGIGVARAGHRGGRPGTADSYAARLARSPASRLLRRSGSPSSWPILAQMTSLVRSAAERYDEVVDDPDALDAMGFAIEMNSLKISASTLVVEIVGRAMTICGMAGYREDSPLSLGRLLRDAHGAAVMVNNDRIIGNNAQMLLVHKDS